LRWVNQEGFGICFLESSDNSAKTNPGVIFGQFRFDYGIVEWGRLRAYSSIFELQIFRVKHSSCSKRDYSVEYGQNGRREAH
jgi:hypothetical protein